MSFLICFNSNYSFFSENMSKGVEIRLSLISSTKNIFDEAKGVYQEALDKAGYKHDLKYNEEVFQSIESNGDKNKNKKKKRSRHSIFFNPPYNSKLKTNISYEVRKLIIKCFPKNHKLYKVVNKNTVFVAFSTTANIEQK